jgi:hypothetical protein
MMSDYMDDDYYRHIGRTIQDMQELALPSPVSLVSYWSNGEPAYLLTVRFGASTFTLALDEDQAIDLTNTLASEIEMMHHDCDACDCGGCTGELN